MDNETWLVLSAAAVGGFAAWSAWSSHRSADAAQGQTEQQRKIHEDSAQPYVWASIVPDEKQGTLLKLVVSNEGPTVATNIRVVFDPRPIPTDDAEHFAAVLSYLESGLSSLPPGQRLEWLFDTAPNFFGTDAERATRVTVDCAGPYGPCPQNSYVMRLSDIEGSQDWPEGTLHLVEERLKEMTKILKDAEQRRIRKDAAKRPSRPGRYTRRWRRVPSVRSGNSA